ncbi:TPA: type I pullulanase [Bacillus anthracis]|uniref:type I pullulanase n=1 Tax=Bacillus anthracis TaxID=1392 RepID=UPI0001DBF915|nr:type I pullulanase [Bacillus cereus]HDR4495737.1 type I pullulanase [Bacillus cereus biovar anthracis]ADK05326.1 pullulanase [Bacillus cereus biovar anthracis str. CI]HDR6228915.1 type I pullulanase [Bacillus cereus biovar anthracis]HDR6232716.1 type I pullulanase [Bacillus cereus biovar anthracis]HDR6239674.1 type I pullulanase [Bacillus cereus biovar anthracis]
MQITKRLINKTVLLLTLIVMLSSVFSFQSVKAVSNSKTTEVIIHYKEQSGNTKDWNLWIWGENANGKSYEFTGEDEFGKYAKINIDGDYNRLGFIIRTNEWEKDGGDRWIENIKDGRAEVWVLSGDEKVYNAKPSSDLSIQKATIDSFHEITVTTNVPFHIKEKKIEMEGIKIKNITPYDINSGDITNKVKIITEQKIDLKQTYKVKIENLADTNTEIGKVIRSEEFDHLFYYGGNDLGNTYTAQHTKFRVWAPTASEAKLVTYKKWNDKIGTEINMQQGEKGTWKAELKGNQKGLYYTYKVKIGDKWTEAVDPYARAASVNGDKGAVIDLEETNPKKWSTNNKPKLKNPEDAIIYELHVRDLSIQPESGIKQKGKYLGVTEKGTKGPEGLKTGLDHMKDLGVTHIQFLPIFDYASVNEENVNEPQYNWGYDPKNFNVPEGSYSTNPYEPTVRIAELKQMIQTLHDNNLRVVMDVVYNHMYNAAESNFHKLVPGYYYRYNEDGTFANGTGVGNDTASERKMMRKFMIDSVTYWAKEYNLDGFRFDLMGIHDYETMNEIRKAVNQIDPSIILHGEGWDLNTPLVAELKANQKNAEKMKGIAHFNDNIRDGLKGSVFEEKENGFVNGKENMEDRIKKGITAGIDYDRNTSTYQDPEQVLTYVEAHDNHTLWDKLELTNPGDSEEVRKQMHKLSSSILLTSQGIPFLHAGQEFMRTKYGDHNSYKSPDSINQMDWLRRAAFNNEVDYMKGLIELRKKYPAFRMTSAEQIKTHVSFIDAPKNTVTYTIEGNKHEYFTVAHNANKEAVEITLPSKGPWKVLVDGKQAGSKPLYVVHDNKIKVPALSSLVLKTEKPIK